MANTKGMPKKKKKAIKRLEARGYKPMGEQHNGFALGRLNENDTTSKVVVNRYGRIRRYKPTMSTERDKQTL